MKLNIGCGKDILEGYINIDLNSPEADMLGDAMYLPFKDNTIDEIFASHLIEHFDYFGGQEAIKEWHRVLKPNGLLALELPNLLALCKEFANNPHYNGGPIIGIYGFPWVDGHTHKMGYSPEQLVWTLNSLGFLGVVRKPTTRHTGWGDMCMRFEAHKL